jgi:hypothetical protein
MGLIVVTRFAQALAKRSAVPSFNDTVGNTLWRMLSREAHTEADQASATDAAERCLLNVITRCD